MMNILIGGLVIFLPLAIVCLVLGIVFFKKARKLKRISLCSECGNELKENDSICGKCGNPIPNAENQKALYYVIVGVSAIGFLYSCIRILRGIGIMLNLNI